MIKMILAVNESGSIGHEGKLMYKLREDLLNFKRMTLNQTVLMGRKTFESLPGPLCNRKNIVVSNNPEYTVPEGVTLLNHEGLLELLEKHQQSLEDIWIIGGKQLYEIAFEYVSTAIVTHIYDDRVGDTQLSPEMKKILFPDDSTWFYEPFSWDETRCLARISPDKHNEARCVIVECVKKTTKRVVDLPFPL